MPGLGPFSGAGAVIFGGMLASTNAGVAAQLFAFIPKSTDYVVANRWNRQIRCALSGGALATTILTMLRSTDWQVPERAAHRFVF